MKCVRETSVCKIELKENGLVYLFTNEDAVIEIPEVKEIYAKLNELVDGKPCFILVFPGTGSTSSKEAREYASAIKREKNIVAEAIIINNIAIRIMATFFMKVNRPRQIVRLFNNEDDAKAWLMNIKLKFERNFSLS